jgi:hypothetical protein
MCQLTPQIRDTLIQAISYRAIKLRQTIREAPSDEIKALFREDLQQVSDALKFLQEQTA